MTALFHTLFVLLLLGVFTLTWAASPVRFDITEWNLQSNTFKNVSKVSATVPGQVHLDLLKAGIIKEPYYGYNQRDQQWITKGEWWYTGQFTLNASSSKRDHIWVQCDGIDAVSKIYVNEPNEAYFYSYSQFKQYFFDIGNYVSTSFNTITVELQPALNVSEAAKEAYPYDVPAPGNYIAGGARNFLRKAQSDFGWDWGPAFVPAGIWRNMEVVAFDIALVTRVSPRVWFLEAIGFFHIDITICVMIPTYVRDPPGALEASTDFPGITQPLNVSLPINFNSPVPLEFCSVLSVDIPEYKIKLWYPSGYGEPTLYQLKVKTTIRDSSNVIATEDFVRTIGFRHVELVQDDLPDGKTFYFRINGIPVFAKGSNFIPADAFNSRATPDYLRRLLQSAKDSNQNMIRVWGGGVYQSDEFYDICDELGIMVWQEFMFADALYPSHTAFLDDVRDEVKYQVLRLQQHPSVVLWGGNNENQNMALKMGAPYIGDYLKLYDDLIRDVVMSMENHIPYWPSSPSNGYLADDPSRGILVQRWGDAQDPHFGDIHRYDYTDPCTDVSKFPNPRFASEFGLQSYPSVTSWLEVSDPSMWGNNSTFMNWRQHHPDGNEQMYNQVKYYTRLPDSPNKTRQFENFVYLTQVVQMVCITAEIEHYRRIRNESHTMGTLYWQLNDIWQAQTWASLEYGGRWKLLHNGVKRAYDKFLISGYLLDKNFTVYMISDDFEKAHSTYFEVDIYTWEGKLANKVKGDSIFLPKLTSKKVFTEQSEVVFKGCSSVEDCFATLSMGDMNKGPLAENVFIPSLVNAPLQHPKISIGSKEIQKTVAKFTVISESVAPFIYLYTKVDGYFSKNGFLALPGKSTAVTFTGHEDLDEATFWDFLQFKNIRDTYQLG